jgi:hypothetical protein
VPQLIHRDQQARLVRRVQRSGWRSSATLTAMSWPSLALCRSPPPNPRMQPRGRGGPARMGG